MQQQELDEIKSAVDRTHSAATSQTQRKQLYEYLDQKLRDDDRCKQMGFYFIALQEDRYRLFGYHCIRKMAKKWSSLLRPDKDDLKQLSLHLFEFKYFDKHDAAQYNNALLKEKISELMVMLTCAAWPGEWKDLFSVLLGIAGQNPISLEMLFIVLKDLYFVCGDSGPMAEKRKKKIKDELMKQSAQILQIFEATLMRCYQQIFVQRNTNNQVPMNILRRCLESMPRYLNQFPLKGILDSQILIGIAKISLAVAQTSNNKNTPSCYDDYYRYGLICIVYFFMRKFSELNTVHDAEKLRQERVLLTLWNIEMETLKGLYMISHDNTSNRANDNTLALQRLDNGLECLLRRLKLFHAMLVREHNDAENNALCKSIRDVCLGVSECSMRSSDLSIRLKAMTIWSYILDEADLLTLIGYDAKQTVFAQSDAFVSVVVGIMKYVLNHFRVQFHDLTSFETEEEWQTSRNHLKGIISRLLQQCFVLCPVKGMECIGQFSMSVLSGHPETPTPHPPQSQQQQQHALPVVNSIGHCTIHNSQYIALDGLGDIYRIVFENSVRYASHKHSIHTFKAKKNTTARHVALIDETAFDGDNSPLLAMSQQLHALVLKYDAKRDTQLLSRVYPLLSALTPLYSRRTQCLQLTFDRLLSDFQQKLPLRPSAADAFDIKCNAVACKRRIAFALLHVAKRIPHVCVQFIQPIWKQVMQIIAANFSSFKSMKQPLPPPTQSQSQPPTATNGGTGTGTGGVVMTSTMELSESPISHLFELLVCISNGYDDAKQRSQILSDLLKDVVSNFNSDEIQRFLNDRRQFAHIMQFPLQAKHSVEGSTAECTDERIRFAYHIRTMLNILQSTLTASLLSEGQTTLKDLFHAATDATTDATTNNATPTEAPPPSWPVFISVFESVLKLNRLLSFMYTLDFKSLIAKEYQSMVICLDVKSLYNLHGLKHEQLLRTPAEKPKFIIPLEKAVVWIQNVRDYVCRFIAVSSYYGDKFFENPQAMQMVTESMSAHWDELPLSHLAIILKHFFMNFVQLCAPKHYPNLLHFLHVFLQNCVSKLDACWQHYIVDFMRNNQPQQQPPQSVLFGNGTHTSNAVRQNSSNLRNEVFHEFALRDASQKLWTAVAMITINHTERGFILLFDDKSIKKPNMANKKETTQKMLNRLDAEMVRKYGMQEHEEGADGGAGAAVEEEVSLKQDKLVLLMLQNPPLSQCLLSAIQMALNWLDNNCHIKCSQVASKLVAFIAKYRMQHLYGECAKIFKCALNALSRNVLGDSQANAELNVLCVTIVQLLGPQCGHLLIEVLQTVPNVDMDDAKSLCALITAPPGKHPNATYRQNIKSFTYKYIIGKQNILSQK